MTIIGLDHVVIRCRDLESMARFYCTVLGCRIDKRNDPLGLIHLRAGASLIDLVCCDGEIGRAGGPAPGPDGHNMDHLCLSIETFDLAELRSHFEKFGIDPGDVQQNYGATGNGPSLYLTDPENNRIELKGPATSGPAA